jgi:hypothetical protein
VEQTPDADILREKIGISAGKLMAMLSVLASLASFTSRVFSAVPACLAWVQVWVELE